MVTISFGKPCGMFLYVLAGIWFAVGDWPSQTVEIVYEGSSYPQSLMFGNRVLFDGGGGDPVQIYTDKWLLTMCILTLLFSVLSLACVRYFKRKSAESTVMVY